jgi:hypothetical protein
MPRTPLSSARHDAVAKDQAARAGAVAMTLATDLRGPGQGGCRLMPLTVAWGKRHAPVVVRGHISAASTLALSGTQGSKHSEVRNRKRPTTKASKPGRTESRLSNLFSMTCQKMDESTARGSMSPPSLSPDPMVWPHQRIIPLR